MRMFLVAALVVALLTSPAGVLPGAAQITDDDLSTLGLVFQNRFVPFSQAQGHPELRSIVARVAALGRAGDSVERYKAMIEGLARMELGGWDEGAEVASILDVNVSAKAYEPGAGVAVRVAPLYQRAAPLTGSYAAQLHLIDPDGTEITRPSPYSSTRSNRWPAKSSCHAARLPVVTSCVTPCRERAQRSRSCLRGARSM